MLAGSCIVRAAHHAANPNRHAVRSKDESNDYLSEKQAFYPCDSVAGRFRKAPCLYPAGILVGILFDRKGTSMGRAEKYAEPLQARIAVLCDFSSQFSYTPTYICHAMRRTGIRLKVVE